MQIIKLVVESSHLMNTSFLGRVWAWVKWPLLVILVLFIGACLYFINEGGKIVKTREAVAKIHVTRLTHNDVFGPVVAEPDRVESDKTLAGIDANKNGIRDDVELDIYHAHQDSAKVTAAMLQYAKELQLEFTSIVSSETWVAVQEVQSRGIGCITELAFSKDESTEQQIKQSRAWLREVEALVFNTEIRKENTEKNLKQYEISYVNADQKRCDLDLKSFAN